eukprot:1068347-Amphidinium_carterae.1
MLQTALPLASGHGRDASGLRVKCPSLCTLELGVGDTLGNIDARWCSLEPALPLYCACAPIQRAILKAKTPEEQSGIAAGPSCAQWTQRRFYRRGLADHPWCTLCNRKLVMRFIHNGSYYAVEVTEHGLFKRCAYCPPPDLMTLAAFKFSCMLG